MRPKRSTVSSTARRASSALAASAAIASGLAPEALDLRDDLARRAQMTVGLVRARVIRERDPRSLAGERLRDGRADAAAAAGDQRDATGELAVHRRHSDMVVSGTVVTSCAAGVSTGPPPDISCRGANA